VAFTQFEIHSSRPGPFARPPAPASSALRRSVFFAAFSPLGISGTGALDTAALHRLLDRVPAGTWELVTHPGYNDADLARVQTRLRASRDIEREALPVLREFPALSLIPFSELIQRH
jgi:hypothetical protein